MIILEVLKKVYQEAMESACREIYAEMVKYALKYPDKIERNKDVIDGIHEVILAIRDKTSVKNSGGDFLSPSSEIIIRNKAEETMISAIQTHEQPAINLPTPILTVEEQNRIEREQLAFELAEYNFLLFSEIGSWPEKLVINASQLHDFRKFALSYSQVAKRYRMLKNTYAQQYNESFDPELHIWEIKEIEWAMDSGFVRNLLMSDSITEQKMMDIKSRQVILDKFIKSSAF